MATASSLESQLDCSSPSPLSPSIENLLEQLVSIRQAKNLLEQQEKNCLSTIQTLIKDGMVDISEPLNWAGWKLSQRKKIKWVYSQELQERAVLLKKDQEMAQAFGEASQEVSFYLQLDSPRLSKV